MKTTSRFALAAAAGLFVGALAFTPAKAADLGGDCCADLEERVAELEATTVRKGNRVVSVQMYGQVNKALLIWDDGIDSDAYVTDNDVSSSRFGLKGKGTIKPGWTAGFRFEFEVDSAASETVGQDDAYALSLGSNGDDGARTSEISVRRGSLYIESVQLGRVTIGLTSTATDDITLIDLGGSSASGQDNDWSEGFLVRASGAGDSGYPSYFSAGLDNPVGYDGGLFWGDIAPGLDLGRFDAIRYDSPSIYGFIVSAAWGEDDFWDVALRFKKEWNSVRVAAGIGYFWDGDDNDEINGVPVVPGAEDDADIESIRGSISIMHVPTGLYATFAAAQLEYSDVDSGDAFIDQLIEDSDPTYYYIQLGISKNWLGYGNTIIYGEYANYQDFGLGIISDFDLGGLNDDVLVGSEVDYWGFGIEQKFDSSALSIYANFKYYEADLTSLEELGDDDVAEHPGAEDWFAVVLGSKIMF